MASKPTIKTAQRCANSGQQGKQLFYDAIHFLFAIKGQEFAKHYPGFLTPSVDEFLSFATTQQTQRINQLHHFIHFLCRDGVFYNNQFRCAYITTWALASYSITEHFLLGSEEVSTEWIQAFQWFSNQTDFRSKITRDVIIATIGKYMDSLYFADIQHIEKTFKSNNYSLQEIGYHVILELQKLDDFCLFITYFQIPALMLINKKSKSQVYKKWIVDQINVMNDFDAAVPIRIR